MTNIPKIDLATLSTEELEQTKEMQQEFHTEKGSKKTSCEKEMQHDASRRNGTNVKRNAGKKTSRDGKNEIAIYGTIKLGKEETFRT